MFRGFKLIKRYYDLAGVKTSLLLFQFIFLLIPALLSILTPVLLSNVISSLTVYDFSKASYFVILDFIIIIISSIIYFLYHIISRKINKTLYINFNDYLYENIKRNKNIKIINLPTITNISVCIEFNKNFLYKMCFLIKSIVTLGIILYYNYLICLIIIVVSFISYLFFRLTDKKIQTNTKHLSTLEQKSLDLFNSIHKGGDIEENYNLNVVLKNKYFNLVEDQVKAKNNISLFYNINNNFISLILKATVFIATIYLIGEIKSTFLTLSLYLILTPYLTSSAQNLISFFDLFSQLGNIENILNEFESLKFSEEPLSKENFDFAGYNLYLYHIYAKTSSVSLKDINIEFIFGKQYFIYSQNQAEISALFKVMQKSIPFSSGTIFIDNKNASDIPIEHYRRIVSSTSNDPFFYNISLIENLLMVCSNKRIISKTLKDIELKPIITTLKNGENTIIDDSTDKELLFLLGIIRSFLSGAKIICIYQLPYELNDKYDNVMSNLIRYLKGKCTLIIFSNKPTNLKFDKQVNLSRRKLKEN